MKKHYFLFSFLLVLLIPSLSFAQPDFKWAGQFLNGDNEAMGMICDDDGNMYLTGSFDGTVDFDPGTGTANKSGSDDLYIAKLDSNGNYVWVQVIGGSGADIGYKIRLDHAGDLIVCGSYSSTVDFDPGPAIANLSNSGGKDAFFAKYDTDGNLKWAKKIAGTLDDEIYSMDIGPDGDYYFTGYYQNKADFDPSPDSTNLIAVGNKEPFFARYDTAGTLIMAESIGSVSNDWSNDIAVDNDKNIVIVGKMDGFSIDFDPGVGTVSRTGQMFYAKYDSSGNYILSDAFGTDTFDEITVCEVDDLGNVYIGGQFDDMIDFDPSGSSFDLTPLYNDLFFAKYDNLGNFIYAKMITSGNSDFMFDMYVDPSNGETYIGTEIGATSDLDPGPGTFEVMPFYHAVFAKYDQFGNFQYGFKIGGGGGSDEDHGNCVLEKDGYLYVAGGHEGGSDVDPDSVDSFTLSSGPNFVSFFGKYGDCNGAPGSPGIITGDTLICEGSFNTYSIVDVAEATSYTWSIPSGWTGSSSSKDLNAFADSTGGIVSVTANNTCGASSASSLTVAVNPKPTVSLDFSSIDTLCQGSSPVALVGESPSGGTFSGPGVTTGTFDPSTAGTYTLTYTYTDTNSCTDSTTADIVVEICAGVQQLGDEGIVNVFPNPSTQRFIIECGDGFTELVVRDITGRLLIHKNLSGPTHSLELDTEGVYFLTLSGNTRSVTRKIAVLKD